MADPLSRLVFSDIVVVPPPECSTAASLRFQIMNTGQGKAVMRALRLQVTEHRASETLRMVETGAALSEHLHHVQLDPEVADYDVRGRTFGPPPPPLSFVEDELESFVVEVTSTRSQYYAFRLVAEWYDTKAPSDIQRLESPPLALDFPPDPAEILGLDDDEPPVPAALDVAAMQGPDLQRLHEALVAAFDTAGLSQFALFTFKLRMETISVGNLNEQVSALVEWASGRGQLSDLITAARDYRPSSPHINALYASLLRSDR